MTSRTSSPLETPAPDRAGAVAPTPTHLAGLDGLRALAVTAVVVFHAFPGLLPGGYVGVDVFFVISGFLITTLLLREREAEGRIRLGRFWLRRARRLLPALAIVIAVSGAWALLLGGDALAGLSWQVLGAATFSSNWLLIAHGGGYFEEASPELFRTFWSLAVEEQFYLLWPLLLLLVLRLPRRLRAGVLVAAGIASAVVMAVLASTDAAATRVYYGTDSHAFGLALGAALALAGRPTGRWRVPAALVGLAAVLLLAATLPEPLAYRGGLALAAAATALVLLGAESPLGRALDVAPLRWLGRRSYAVYLWHWPLLVLLGQTLPDAPAVLIGSAAIAGSLAASAVSYRFVELPIRRDGFRAQLPRLRRPVAACAAVVLLALTGMTAAAVASDPGEVEAQQEVAQGVDAVAAPVEPAALPGGDQIVAIGDSVMLAAAPELHAAYPGILVDAVVSRQMRQLPEIVAGMVEQGTMRDTVVLGLGTNGSITRGTLEEVVDLLPSDVRVVVVNVQAPRDWVDGVNRELEQFALEHRNVELANWRDAIAPRLDLLGRDRIHPADEGAKVYVGAVTDALQRLAEVPPLLSENEYGLAPRVG